MTWLFFSIQGPHLNLARVNLTKAAISIVIVKIAFGRRARFWCEEMKSEKKESQYLRYHFYWDHVVQNVRHVCRRKDTIVFQSTTAILGRENSANESRLSKQQGRIKMTVLSHSVWHRWHTSVDHGVGGTTLCCCCHCCWVLVAAGVHPAPRCQCINLGWHPPLPPMHRL